MLIIALIFIVGLAPACISAYLSIREDRAAKDYGVGGAVSPLPSITRMLEGNDDMHYVDGLGYMVGDITCDLNARSPYLRCAINPLGPCDGCSAYAPRVFDRQV
ncbi:hypothetical protein GFS31_15900 [Leptolyngbya sp. BL0902]|uniref:DUF6464 family protein n=1 Tax=Leptolyngbya sp. BL0902 TaxID=1115757 RepID=UPI0018E74E4E|nr:DUF6464 family protein [Leptolyngbya sp. BL0902]QQE64906.1 hypothetical protein GFS31_15900 [Leptolyngbya sp. BL0902]